ncbi:MAG TPA: 2OG-Fe(II) oxygenase, partial [Allocoleopsis sp.]
VCQLESAEGGISYDPTTFILDENLRILDIIPLETHVPPVDRLLSAIQQIPASAPPQLMKRQAPALLIPDVFPAEFCQYLIDLYEADGGTESGFMKQDGSQAVVTLDYGIKRRKDLMITDPALLSKINYFIGRRLVPEVFKAFQFRITRFERYLVGCYEDTTQGFFKPHRDNVNAGAAHRRFALSLNLNAGYEGGCLRFPEYGGDLYCPPAGSAVVFSCSLLHEVTPVTQGRRFTLLSFLYNDEDAKLREQTRKQIVRQDGTNAIFDAGNQAIEASSQSGQSGKAQVEKTKFDRSPTQAAKRRKNSPSGF